MQTGRATHLIPSAVLLAALSGVLAQEATVVLLPAVLLSLGAAAGILGLVEGLGAVLGGLAGRKGERLATSPARRLGSFAASQTGLALAPLVLAAAVNWPLAGLGRILGWAALDLEAPLRDALGAEITPAKARERLRDRAWFCGAVAAVGAPLTLCFVLWLGVGTKTLLVLAALPAFFSLWATLRLLKAGSPRRSGAPKGPSRRPHVDAWAWSGLGVDARRFLAFAGLFSLGDFSPAFFVLYAIVAMDPAGAAGPALAWAAGLYALRNILQIGGLHGAERIGSRLSPRAVQSLGWACGAAAVALLIQGVNSPGGLALTFSLSGLGAGLAESSEEPLLLSTLPEGGREAGLDARALSADLCAGLGSLTLGVVWVRFGAANAFEFAFCLMGAGLLGLLADSRPMRDLLKEI